MSDNNELKFKIDIVSALKQLDTKQFIDSLKQADAKIEDTQERVDNLNNSFQDLSKPIKPHINISQARKALSDLEKMIRRVQNSPRHTVNTDEFINIAKTIKESGQFAKQLEDLTKDISVKINGAVVNGIDNMISEYEKGVTKIGKIKFTPPAPTFSQEYIDKSEKEYKAHMVKLVGISRKLSKAISENASFNEIADLKNTAETEKEALQELASVLKNNNDLIKNGAKAVKQYRDAVKQLDDMKVGDQVVSEPKSVTATKEQIKALTQLKKEAAAASKAFHEADSKLHDVIEQEKKLTNAYGEITDYIEKIEEISTKRQNVSLEDLPAAKQKKQHTEYVATISDIIKEVIAAGGAGYRANPMDYSHYRTYAIAVDDYKKHTNQELNDMLARVMSEVRKVYTETITALTNADKNQTGFEREAVLKKRALAEQHAAATLNYNTSADKSSEATRKLYDYEKELEELGVDVRALNEQIEKSLTEAKKPKKTIKENDIEKEKAKVTNEPVVTRQKERIEDKNTVTKENVEAIKQEVEAHKANAKVIEAEKKTLDENQQIRVKGSISYMGRSKNDFDETLEPTAIIYAKTTDESNYKAIENIIESWFKDTGTKENYSATGSSDDYTWFIPVDDRNEYEEFKEHWLKSKKQLAATGKLSTDITQETQDIQQQTKTIKEQTEAHKENVEAIESERKAQEELNTSNQHTESKIKYYEIDEKAARIAKQMRSFDDYKEGSATASYKAAIDKIAEVVDEKKKQFPDKSDQLDKLFDRYAKNLATYINKDNQIGARYPSVMISGAGNYNTKKHDKQLASWGKNYQFYEDKVLALENQIRTLGGGTEVIRGDEENALEKLEAKVEYLKHWHQVMVDVNKYYRKNKTLEGFEGVDTDELERIKKDLADAQRFANFDVPYPQFTLANDNQNIKRLEGRLKELKRLKSEGGSSDSIQETNDIYKLWVDKQDMRIRISFEIGKPEQEIINMLKGKAFKWSPKNQAWQRQLTSNAIYDTKKLKTSLNSFYGIGEKVQSNTISSDVQTPDSLLKEISASEIHDAHQIKEQQSVERALLEASKKKLELENKDVEKVAEQLALDTSAVEEKKAENKTKTVKKTKSKKTTTPDEGQLSLFDIETEQQILQTEQAISKEDIKQIELAKQNTSESTKELETAKEQLNVEQKIAAEKKKQIDTNISASQIIEQQLEDALKTLSTSKNNKTSLFNLGNVVDGDSLVIEAQNMVEKIAEQANLKLGKFKVSNNTIYADLYDDDLKVAVQQVYMLNAATEEAEASLELFRQSYTQNVKALAENKFDVEGTIAKAVSEVEKLKSSAHGLKFDFSDIEGLAKNIKSQDDFKKFNNILKAYQNNIQAIKNSTTTKNSMNPLANMQRDMKNAEIEIDTMKAKLESLGDVKGVVEANALINQMTISMKKFNAASDEKGQQSAYNNYSDYRSQFNAQLKYINAQINLEKKQKQLEQKQAKEQQQNAAASKTLQEQPVKQTYESLLGTIKKINSINQDILKYQDKDNGSGVLSSFISGLKSDKQTLEAELKSITDRITSFYADGFIQGDKIISPFSSSIIDEKDYSSIAAFLNDIKTQSILSEKEVDNLLNTLKKAQEIDITVADKMVDMFKPFNEVNSRLAGIKGLDKNATSPLVGMFSEIKTYKDKLASQEITWDSEETSYLKKLIEAYTEYGSKLADIAEKEQRYFADKQKYTSGMKLSDITNTNSENEKAYSGIRKKLEDTARKMAEESGKGQIFTTGFSQGADGIAKLDFSVFDSATKSLQNFRLEMGSVTNSMSVTETTVSKSLSNINAARKQLETSSNLLGVLGSSGIDIGDGATKSVSKFVGLIKSLDDALNSGDETGIAKYAKDLRLMTSEIDKAYKQTVKMQDGIDNGSLLNKGVIDTNGNIYAQAKQQIEAYAQSLPNATVNVGAFNEQTGKIPFTINVANKEMRKCEAQINSLNGQMTIQERSVSQVRAKISQTSNAYDKFKISLASVGKQLATAAIGYNVFYKALSMFRTGVGYVKEIDLAMTELKKVTDETAATYDKFLKNAYDSAGAVGATVSDFTEASSNFARLGYTLDESSQMAQTAIVYKNVADGLDNIDDATESIVSTMKAFNIEASDTMSIADKFNEIGNNYAITSAGVGEALKRSASSLAAAGNSLDESIALVTGANAVVQNPEVVGTALKTLSLRIRNVKTELEDADLDAENMAETTAVLHEKLLALSHGKVDILKNTNEFKSTTEILRELAAAWEDMTDMEQAAAIELVAGKRQAKQTNCLNVQKCA